MSFSSVLARFAVLALTVSVAACGGTSGSTPAGPVATATPTTAATLSTASITTSTTGTAAFPTVSESSISSAVVLPVASAAVSVTETISSTPPAGATALSSVRKAAAAVRHIKDTDVTPIAYLEFTTTGATTIASSPSFTFMLPIVTAGADYYISAYAATGWTTILGPATISGNTVTFASVSGTPVTFAAGTPIILALYESISTGASPTPSPSPSPIAPVASVSSLVFDASTPGETLPVTVTEANYTGTFTASLGTCTNSGPIPVPSPEGIGPKDDPTPTVSPTADVFEYVANLENTTGTSFTVINGEDLGTCTLTITDSNNLSTTVSVENDATQIQPFAAHRAKH